MTAECFFCFNNKNWSIEMNVWKITHINCILDQDGKQNIVKEVEFSVDGLVNGTAAIPYEDGNFLSYSELTEGTVIGWVKSALTDSGVAYYEDMVAQLKAPPTTGYKGLPWAEGQTAGLTAETNGETNE